MDLWIRSQDRESLKKINTGFYLKRDLSEYAKGEVIFVVSGGDKLGEYETKERALEVLDEIQKLLTTKMIIKNEGRDCVALDGTIYRTNIVSNINSDIQQLSTYVYEMPKE